MDTEGKCLYYMGQKMDILVVYTGAADELLGCRYGRLPYRSFRFEWNTLEKDSFQRAPMVAYPQAEGYTRITEYKKLPVQNISGKTTIAVEYPLPYKADEKREPYYPVPNDENKRLYERYRRVPDSVHGLYVCGRLADYQYYNMDQALENALILCDRLKKELA